MASSSYASAMAREAERLTAATKRNLAAAQSTDAAADDDGDAKEDAWASVFRSGQAHSVAAEEEEARRKKQRKAERRKEKQAAEAANAVSLSLYVTGVPKDVSWTAVQALFARAGEVRRVKLYKDASGEQKGDGLVTFAREEGVREALGREWNLHGDVISVQAANFDTKPAGVPRADWQRICVLTQMFAVEELAEAADRKAFLGVLEEETWVECLRHGPVERVQAFPADTEFAIAVRFADASSAASCVLAMEGRWFSERRVGAALYDGNRKRAPDEANDQERIGRLQRPPSPLREQPQQPQQPQQQHAEPPPTVAESRTPLVLPSGGYVKLRNLVGAAERNGQVGIIKDHDSASDRYRVELRDGKILALRRGNLLQMVSVRLAGLEGEASAHNGAAGTVFDFDATSELYGVELGSGDALPVPVGAVILPDGSVACVGGLQSEAAKQYNGQLARVLSHDAEAARYDALLDGGKQLRLRRQNLFVCG
jgi:HIV Tat-specific factor 1